MYHYAKLEASRVQIKQVFDSLFAANMFLMKTTRKQKNMDTTTQHYLYALIN